MKKLTVLIALILMLATLLSACTGSQTPPMDGTTGTTPATEPVTDPPEIPATLKIGGVDISQYKIIYPVNAEKKAMMSAYRAETRTYWRTEFDAEAQTAARLANLINMYFGVRPTTGVDTAEMLKLLKEGKTNDYLLN